MGIIKIPKRSFKNSNGLSKDKYFMLEIDCLELIQKNYKCKCHKDKRRKHFPIIINYNIDKYELEMSDQGTSILQMISEKKKLKIKDAEKQIDCIIRNLKRSHIRHLDLHHSGKNMCVNKYGVISLIDFDVASIGSEYESTVLEERANKYGNYKSYLIEAKKKMMDMVKKVML